MIPTSFELGGIEWTVEDADFLAGNMGICHTIPSKIYLQSDLPQQIKEHTFYHELVHAILFSMGKPADTHDEIFVDAFALFLHQFSKTLTYPPNDESSSD